MSKASEPLNAEIDKEKKHMLDMSALPKHIRIAFEEITVEYAKAALLKKERDALASDCG